MTSTVVVAGFQLIAFGESPIRAKMLFLLNCVVIGILPTEVGTNDGFCSSIRVIPAVWEAL